MRELSGITRPELLKQLFAPVITGTEMTNINSHPACNIDHAGDCAYMAMRVPNQPAIRDVQGFYLVIVGKAIVANMAIDVDINFGSDDEALAAATTAAFTQTTAANTYYFIDMSGAGGNWGGSYGDVYGIKAYYKLTAAPTNCYVLGTLLLWY